MPELTGSAKQVAWAEDIRQGALQNADNLTSRFNEMQSRAPASDKTFAEDALGYNLKDAAVVQKEVVSSFQGVTSASQIIDARNQFSSRQLQQLAQLEHRTGQISEAQRRRKS